MTEYAQSAVRVRQEVAAPDDRVALHAESADALVEIASYLAPAEHVRAARESGADAVHPGYGFLSESPKLAQAVVGAGLAWIGPPPDVLELAGDKVACRTAFEKTGFPVLPAVGPLASPEEAIGASRAVGFPLMVKAVMGGGGIGMGHALAASKASPSSSKSGSSSSGRSSTTHHCPNHNRSSAATAGITF